MADLVLYRGATPELSGPGEWSAGIPLASVIGAVAKSQNRDATTPTIYRGIYERFHRYLARELGRNPVVGDVSRTSLTAYRDHLAQQGGRGGAKAKPKTVETHLAALRTLAKAINAPAGTLEVKGPSSTRQLPKALSLDEYANLLSVPDRRTTQGRRDYAVLRVLADAGLRQSELRRLNIEDLQPSRAGSSKLMLHVTRGKGGGQRQVSVSRDAARAIEDWQKVRPRRVVVDDVGERPLFVTLGRHGRDSGRRITAEAVRRLVEKYTTLAQVRKDRRNPHALRHTFCTHQAEAGVDLDVIRDEAGHASIQTTLLYTEVADWRREDAVDQTEEYRARSKVPGRRTRRSA